MSNFRNQIQFLLQEAASLLLYQSVFSGEVGQSFLQLLETLNHQETRCLAAYGSWFRSLAATGQSWQDYLITRVLCDDNPLSSRLQKVSVEELPPALVAAAKQDLQALQHLYNCSGEELSGWVKATAKVNLQPVVWHLERASTTFLHQQSDWAESLEELARHYGKYGTGIFAEFKAFTWQQGYLQGIAHPDPVRLSQIVGYESQKATLVKNTEFLLAGYPALHVLLYGSRGSGKSSLVKGLLNEYGTRGLRLVEVGKAQLQDLPTIVEQLRDLPQKFVLFVDDLSFEEDDDAFKALKVVLEGSLTAKAQNVVVYATSNRRHLVREFFSERPRPSDRDEVQAWDTLQEKLSFSDRFGLTITFESANQSTYLEIVHHLAEQAKISLSATELEFRAKQWATRHNGRSGRSARQFIDFLQGELALGNN